MFIKKLLVCCFVGSGAMSATQIYKKTWFSGIEKLDVIESLKFEKLCGDLNLLCADVFDEKFCEKMKPCLTKWSKKYEQLDAVENSDKNSKKNKKQSVQLLKKMQQDKELSLLVKNLAEVFDAYLSECVDVKDGAYQNLLKVLAQYFPEKADFNQIYLDYIISSYEYLDARLHKKDMLKIDDISYVLEQFMYSIKQNISFSVLYSLKKSYYMWTSLVSALEKGMKDQPKDVQKYFIKKVEKCMKDSDVKALIESIKSMNCARKEIVKNASKSVDAVKLKEYEALLDVAIAQMSKVVATHVGKKNPEAKFYTMTEKLVFVG